MDQIDEPLNGAEPSPSSSDSVDVPELRGGTWPRKEASRLLLAGRLLGADDDVKYFLGVETEKRRNSYRLHY